VSGRDLERVAATLVTVSLRILRKRQEEDNGC